MTREPATAAPAADPESAAPAVLQFPDGIPGFADAHEFVVGGLTDDGVFQLFQSVEHPDLSMVVSTPWLFFPDYAPVLSDEDQRVLGLERVEDAMVFCAVTADDAGDQLYANLLGPFVVNARSLRGRQVVLVGQDWPVRAPLPAGT